MIDISKTPNILVDENSRITCYEYVIGYRFTIHINDGKVHISQDEEFNKNLFGDLLDLEDTWERLTTNYRVTPEGLISMVMREYDIECILFNGMAMKKKEMDISYPGIGIIAVGATIDGLCLGAKQFAELCLNVNIPYLKFSFCGEVDMFTYKAAEYINQSMFARDGISAGAVIVNDPPVFDGDKTKRFLIRLGESIERGNDEIVIEDASLLARELVRHSFGPHVIINLETRTGVSPVLNKVKFRNICLNYIKQDLSADYMDYVARANLPKENKEKEFDSMLKEEIKALLASLTSQMDRYRLVS